MAAGEDVVHLHLMFKNHERFHVTALSEVTIRIEEFFECGGIQCLARLRNTTGVLAVDGVAAVYLSFFTCYVPTAPAVANGGSVIYGVGA